MELPILYQIEPWIHQQWSAFIPQYTKTLCFATMASCVKRLPLSALEFGNWGKKKCRSSAFLMARLTQRGINDIVYGQHMLLSKLNINRTRGLDRPCRGPAHQPLHTATGASVLYSQQMWERRFWGHMNFCQALGLFIKNSYKHFWLCEGALPSLTATPAAGCRGVTACRLTVWCQLLIHG